jgi:hypothetical protein
MNEETKGMVEAQLSAGAISIEELKEIQKENRHVAAGRYIELNDVDFIKVRRCVYCRGSGDEDIFNLLGGWSEN